MTEPDREAFEALMNRIGHQVYKSGGNGQNPVEYASEGGQVGWIAWQAARDHYAPKLTAEDAMRALFNVHREIAALDMGMEVDELLTFEQSRESADEDERTPYLNAVENINALRAAGVRFRESEGIAK